MIIIQTRNVGSSKCSGQCEKTTIIDDEGFRNYALLGHTFRILTNSKLYACHYNCFMECRCMSYQMSNAGCELLDEDRFSKPASFRAKDGFRYYDIKRESVNQSNILHDGSSCSNTTCQNGCCKSQPCLNNGQCNEYCNNPRLKFNCTCPEGHTGKLCQIKARSCKDYIGYITNGKYVIYSKAGYQIQVFCDFGSEKGFAWTLVESFSLQNNFKVKSYAFFKNRPLNEHNPNWELYRLSHSNMKGIADVSKYFRATCQFPVEGIKYVDYVRGKLSVTKLLKPLSWQCHKYDYINIRGHQCYNCTAKSWQTTTLHMHLSSYHSHGCTLRRVPGTAYLEYNFGVYRKKNHHHRCSADQTSTTQWWLGGP